MDLLLCFTLNVPTKMPEESLMALLVYDRPAGSPSEFVRPVQQGDH